MEKLSKEQWQEAVLSKPLKELAKRRISIGVAWDQENMDYINKSRGQIPFSIYVNGIITALREYHEGEKKKLFTSLSLQTHAMFKLRELLDALGYTKVGQGTIKFEPHYRGDHIIDFEGKKVGVIVVEVTYEGKARNQVDNFFNAEDDEADAPWNPGTAKEM